MWGGGSAKKRRKKETVRCAVGFRQEKNDNQRDVGKDRSFSLKKNLKDYRGRKRSIVGWTKTRWEREVIYGEKGSGRYGGRGLTKLKRLKTSVVVSGKKEGDEEQGEQKE